MKKKNSSFCYALIIEQYLFITKNSIMTISQYRGCSAPERVGVGRGRCGGRVEWWGGGGGGGGIG